MSFSPATAAVSRGFLPSRTFICLRCQRRRVFSSSHVQARRASSATTSNIFPHGQSSRRLLPDTGRTQSHSARLAEQTRFIAHTLPRKDTVAITNPRNDEEGQEMSIDITSRASKRLYDIMQREKDPSLMLRIQVTSGGCHGFQYLMSLESSKATNPASTSTPTSTSTSDSATSTTTTSILQSTRQSDPAPPSSPSPQSPSPTTNPSSSSSESNTTISKDDTIFQATDGTEAKVIMDEPSLELLKGSKVDYSTELIGSQFRIADNPRAKSSCGCGTSFDVAE